MIVITHAYFFEWLEGKGTDQIPQSYVTTASTILANGIGILLQMSLGSVFTQYLWHLVRFKSFKASFLDDLFSMRSSVQALFRVIITQKAWILILLSLFLWSITVAVSFQPGAITIEAATKVSTTAIPSFGMFNVSPLNLFSQSRHLARLFIINCMTDQLLPT